MAQASSGQSKRGFAAMDAKKQREIAAKGGRASHGSRKKKRSVAQSDNNSAAML